VGGIQEGDWEFSAWVIVLRSDKCSAGSTFICLRNLLNWVTYWTLFLLLFFLAHRPAFGVLQPSDKCNRHQRYDYCFVNFGVFHLHFLYVW